MGNEIFRDRLNAKIAYALAEARNCSRLDHPGMIGEVRQIVIDNLLKPLMPDGVHIGSGKITDAKGNLSAETDIVIYDRRSIPPILFDDKNGVFPIEAVSYAIEIKSKLTATECRSSIQKDIQLRALSGPPPLSALFAFASDLTAGLDSNRFMEAQEAFSVPLPIDIFWIAGREYGFFKNGWKVLPPQDGNAEIVSFLVGIMNTMVGLRNVTRHVLEPGWYFFPGHDPQ